MTQKGIFVINTQVYKYFYSDGWIEDEIAPLDISYLNVTTDNEQVLGNNEPVVEEVFIFVECL